MARDRYGLFGWPVKHSVSPQMQEAGFRAIGRDATYELLPVAPAHLAAKVAEVRAAGFSGWNITVPHKTAMLDLVDHVDPTARQAGSINTVRLEGGKARAWSTDGYGLATSIRESFGLEVEGEDFCFWGTGGAARATAVWFGARGARRLVLVNRTLAKAEALAADIRTVAPDCELTVLGRDDLGGIEEALRQTSVLIQSTSIGLHADDPCAVPADLLDRRLRVLDMIYRPTKLLAAARAKGCPTADGRAMLLYQGVRSFELWTDQEAPVAAMRAALDQALDAPRG